MNDVGGAEAVFLLLQFLEEAEHPAARDVRLAEELRAGRVGGRFLDAAEREVAAHRCLLARRHDAGACFAAAGRHRGEAEDHRQEVHAHCGLGAAVGEDDVAVGDVAELVRDDALDFVGVVGGLDEP
jgi:hypothetical protein